MVFEVLIALLLLLLLFSARFRVGYFASLVLIRKIGLHDGNHVFRFADIVWCCCFVCSLEKKRELQPKDKPSTASCGYVGQGMAACLVPQIVPTLSFHCMFVN